MLTDQKTLVLNISRHRKRLADKYRKEHEESEHWAGTLGSLKPQLAALGLVGGPPEKGSHDFSDLKVLGVEDNDSDRDKLREILSEIGCNYELPKTFDELVSILEKSNSFDNIILDKNLDEWRLDLKGYDLLPLIRKHQISATIAAMSLESPDQTQEGFNNPDVHVYEKPYKKELIEDFFERSSGQVKTSSLKTLKAIDESFKKVRNFLTDDISFEDHLRRVLHILYSKDIENLSAAIVRMDEIGKEVSLISNIGLKDIPWSTYKSILRHTPISDVILGNQTVFFPVTPESRKKNFPKPGFPRLLLILTGVNPTFSIDGEKIYEMLFNY